MEGFSLNDSTPDEKDNNSSSTPHLCLPENLMDTAKFDLGILLMKIPGNSLKTLKCLKCNFTHHKIEGLMVHEKYVHDMNFYTCEICSRQTKTEDGLEFHMKRRHPDFKRRGSNNKPSTNTLESVKSKYVLSKCVEGLETSPIVNARQTICMMAGTETNKSFQFQSRRINVKTTAIEKLDNSFFRTSTEMEEEILKHQSKQSQFYLGNLRNKNAFLVLKKDFLCVTDCESTGNLKETSKDTIVFIKLLKCETDVGKKRHLPMCLKCNGTEKTKAIINSISKNVKVTEKFVKDNIATCIHSIVGEQLFSKKESKKEEDSQTNCKVVLDDSKKHLCISFDGESHGLIWVNIARKAKKGTCLTCKSIRCKHIQVWNTENKSKVFKENTSPQKDTEIANANQEDATSDDGSEGIEDKGTSITGSCQSINYPYDKATQQRMRETDGSYYDKLSDLVSQPEEGAKCDHGNEWSLDDPIGKEWKYTSNVNIVHSTYVLERKRTLYYRRTTGDCKCILIYDGKPDMLLPVRQCKQTNGLKSNQITSDNDEAMKMGNHHVVHLVSLSLLADFANEFFKNGTTMRGFHKAYISKCQNKFGMSDRGLISWATWRLACKEFFINVLKIDEKEIFKCRNCGPRPKVLVIDGIAMGLMKSLLDKNEEDLTNDLGKKSKIEFVGSKYKDRMFIKLSRNRKKIRSAAIEKDWPVLGNDGDSDTDTEYEVGEKRKKREHDEGMEIFSNFLKELDQSVEPSSAILMLMQNLSSSTSTVGMMQEFDEDLIHKIQLFLEGDEKYNFLSGMENLQLQIDVRRKYPILMKILEASVDPDGNLKKPIRCDVLFSFYLFMFVIHIQSPSYKF